MTATASTTPLSHYNAYYAADAPWWYSVESSFEWIDIPDDVKLFGYIEISQTKYIAPHVTQMMQEPFRGNKFRLGGQKT